MADPWHMFLRGFPDVLLLAAILAVGVWSVYAALDPMYQPRWRRALAKTGLCLVAVAVFVALSVAAGAATR